LFNAEQVEGVKVPGGVIEEGPAFTPIEAAVSVAQGYRDGPVVEHGGSVACYYPAPDLVRLPNPQRFENPEGYYATLFHELVHSTGNEKRLKRGVGEKLAPFGSPDYSKEELVAEIGAAFLCATAGISPPTIEQSAAYLEGWRRSLKADKKLVIAAAGQGQRAADHILGVTFEP
jgi:antirestriction protein ArdC